MNGLYLFEQLISVCYKDSELTLYLLHVNQNMCTNAIWDQDLFVRYSKERAFLLTDFVSFGHDSE
jgi:hypothetical protein